MFKLRIGRFNPTAEPGMGALSANGYVPSDEVPADRVAISEDDPRLINTNHIDNKPNRSRPIIDERRCSAPLV